MDTRNTLDELYSYLNGAIRYERYIMALCPWHDDHKPSLAIYPDTYYCHSCNKRGKTADLLQELKQAHGHIIEKRFVDFHSPWSGWKRRFGSLENTISTAHTNLIRNSKTAYLQKRGIDIPTIKKLRIGWLEDWITFPIYDRLGDLVGGTARASETNKTSAKYCVVPNQDPNLLYVPSWELIDQSSCAWLVYGIIDAISLYQLGVASMSTTTGKRTNADCFDSIRKMIYIIPDRGEEIEACMLSANLSWRGKTIKVDWPDDSKDCNDLYLKHKSDLVHILEQRV